MIWQTLIVYTYVCTGYCYIIHCLKVIIPYEKLNPIVELKRKKIRIALYVTFGLFIVLFIVQYLVLFARDCKSYLLSESLWAVMAMYFVTCFFVMTSNLFLWRRITKRRRMTESRKRKHICVSIAFGSSYIYRAISDAVQKTIDPMAWDDFKNLGGQYNFCWCLFLFGLHFVGELVPMFLLFWLQNQSLVQNHKKNNRFSSQTDQSSQHSSEQFDDFQYRESALLYETNDERSHQIPKTISYTKQTQKDNANYQEYQRQRTIENSQINQSQITTATQNINKSVIQRQNTPSSNKNIDQNQFNLLDSINTQNLNQNYRKNSKEQTRRFSQEESSSDREQHKLKTIENNNNNRNCRIKLTQNDSSDSEDVGEMQFQDGLNSNVVGKQSSSKKREVFIQNNGSVVSQTISAYGIGAKVEDRFRDSQLSGTNQVNPRRYLDFENSMLKSQVSFATNNLNDIKLEDERQDTQQSLLMISNSLSKNLSFKQNRNYQHNEQVSENFNTLKSEKQILAGKKLYKFLFKNKKKQQKSPLFLHQIEENKDDQSNSIFMKNIQQLSPKSSKYSKQQTSNGGQSLQNKQPLNNYLLEDYLYEIESQLRNSVIQEDQQQQFKDSNDTQDDKNRSQSNQNINTTQVRINQTKYSRLINKSESMDDYVDYLSDNSQI
eukprot:403356713